MTINLNRLQNLQECFTYIFKMKKRSGSRGVVYEGGNASYGANCAPPMWSRSASWRCAAVLVRWFAFVNVESVDRIIYSTFPYLQQAAWRHRGRYLACTYHTVMITLKLIPDIRKGSEGVARSARAAMSNCWR